MNNNRRNIMTSNKIISIEELWQFYNLSANMVCIAGNSEYFNHINPSFAQLLDFTEEELVSTPYLDLIHPDDREITSKEINELKNGKPVSIFQNRHKMKSGNYKWLSWTANRSNADGNIYAIGLDCTENSAEEYLELKQTPEKTTSKIEWLEIAKELRDNINHLLQKSPLNYDSDDGKNTSNYSLLQHSSAAVLSVVSEIKKLSATLAGYLNEELDITDNIAVLIKETMGLYPMRIKFYAQNFLQARFNKKVKQDIIKIIREQLNNIINQASATTVQINLEQISDKLFISIQDNGRDLKKNKSIETSAIAKWAAQYKGEVFVDAEPGYGCTMSVTLIEPALQA